MHFEQFSLDVCLQNPILALESSGMGKYLVKWCDVIQRK